MSGSSRERTETAIDRLLKYGENLTPTELAVLTHFASGMPTKTIATKLAMSVRTVGYHKQEIMRKSNTACMVAAMAFYGTWTLHDKYTVVRDNRGWRSGLHGYVRSDNKISKKRIG